MQLGWDWSPGRTRQVANQGLEKPSKMGQRDIRRLLASGAMAVLQAVERFGTPHNSWLISMLERKPRMLVAIAMANKMARRKVIFAWIFVDFSNIFFHLS